MSIVLLIALGETVIAIGTAVVFAHIRGMTIVAGTLEHVSTRNRDILRLQPLPGNRM